MSKVDKQALRELAEKATPGAWGKDGVYVCTTITAGETIYVQTWDAVAESHQESNAQFIAAANPATVLALLDEIETLRTCLAETAGVAVTMLYESHKADTIKAFTVEELSQMVETTKHLADANVQVEEVYRKAWNMTQGGAERGR